MGTVWSLAQRYVLWGLVALCALLGLAPFLWHHLQGRARRRLFAAGHHPLTFSAHSTVILSTSSPRLAAQLLVLNPGAVWLRPAKATA